MHFYQNDFYICPLYFFTVSGNLHAKINAIMLFFENLILNNMSSGPRQLVVWQLASSGSSSRNPQGWNQGVYK
jgi:hypothetical protein